jgi:tyrosyl-tRNA synthetase
MDTDDRIDVLLTKGVAEILPNRDFVYSHLKSNKKLTVYAGFDPTAATLHIGHTTQLRKLRQFQDLGHKVIFLIGDFTARIGDPTDKSAVRKQLTEKEIKENLRLYKKQAGKFLRFSGKNAAIVKFNNTWLGRLKFGDVLSLASHMTVDQMLKRDMFTKRVQDEKPIYLHEFLYPLMQGYDSVALDVDGEVGGNDQLFNMMTGRTLLKQMKDKEKFVITLKLLEDGSGKKMGKSEGNMVSLLDTPSDMYGKVMSWPDGLILPGFELCTDYTPLQLSNIKDELANGINPRDIKMRLAYEIVRTCTDEKDAQKAEETFVTTFQRREVAEDIAETIGKDRTLEEIFLDEHLVSSKADLRRLAEANAVIDFATKTPLDSNEIKEKAKPGTYKIGKNRFIKIV